jgi:glucose/arabinose dehydrogenase
LSCIAFAFPAGAQLEGDFADRLSVDTEYVTGADGATDIAFSDDGRAVITRKDGQIAIRRSSGTLAVVDNPFGGTVDTESEKGLLGVVADPRGGNAFYFYVSNGSTDDDKHRVYRAVLTDGDTFTVDEQPIIAASRNLGPGLEGPLNHDGGGLSIYDNHLYVSVGDTGSNATPPQNKYGSCLNKGNGKVLRVNLDGTIPNDNPLVGLTSVTGCDAPRGAWAMSEPDERVFIWGFRNPFRLWIDPVTGLVWVGDVGETTREEISILSMAQHAGYPFEEGTRVWGDVDNQNCTTMTPSRPCTPPVHDYARTQGAAVTGGLIPEGCGWSNVFSTPHYLFADSGEDFIRALQVNGERTGLESSTAIDFANYNEQRPVAFRMGPDESLYVVMYGAGAVYRFTPTDRTGADCGGAGTGGTSAGTGATGSGGAAGSSTGTGGITGAGGTGTAGGGDSSDDGGCGCRLTRPRVGTWLALMAVAALLAMRRRRAPIV